MQPRISVVCPVYNQPHLISNAIMSIRNQTIDNWELIIVNDGSSDKQGLINVIERFDDPRIRLFHFEQNHGLVTARNFGNQQAKADIIAIQDADDLSMPNRLEKCLFEMNNADVIIHGAVINMWDKQFNCISRKYLPPGRISKSEILNGQNLTGWPIFRKKVWQEKPFRIETQYAYDHMMHLDWLYSDFRYRAVYEILYEYVRTENSASQIFERDGRRKQSMDEIKRLMKKEYGIKM